MPNTFLIVAGPSCAGKSPLVKALKRLYPELAGPLREPVLYHSRKPRPGEADGDDYHFRSSKEIKALKGDPRFRVFKVRDQRQAVDLDEVKELLAAGSVVYEGNVEISLAMKALGADAGARVIDLFLSPLSAAEAARLSRASAFEDRLVEMMRRRQLRRAAGKNAHLSLPDLQDAEVRAGTILAELAEAHRFGHVVPCADGEDSDHWTLFSEPVGDAGRAVRAVAALLSGAPDAHIERWTAETVQGTE
jgi:guanylate kinase